MTPAVRASLAVWIGATILLWPALFNGYPILYSDTSAFLLQSLAEMKAWDKPLVYGPWLSALHLRETLWLPCLAQALIVSYVLWMIRKTFARPSVLHHIAVCLVLGGLTATPWFVSLLMPDIFAPLTVLTLFLLAFCTRLTRTHTVLLVMIAALSIGVHLTHIVIAAGCLVVIAVMKSERLKLALLPLAIALATLVATNIVYFEKVAISPFGSVFMLARLATDGPAAEVLAQRCPAASWHMCHWKDTLPDDSDAFMWAGDGPVWSHPGGPIGLAPEASEIVLETLRHAPVAVLRSAIRNTWRQLFLVELGDTLHPDHLQLTVAQTLADYFPAAELEQFQSALQANDTLAAEASRLAKVQLVTMILGCLATLGLLIRALIVRDEQCAALVVMVLVGLCINAFATGALSKPHLRYQTRIAWLLVLVPLVVPLSRKKHDIGS